MRLTRAGTALAVLAAAYAVVLACLVVSPISDQLYALMVRISVDWRYHPWLPGHPSPAAVGFGLNVLLFVPVGLLGGAASRRPWWVVVVLCALLSAGIELVQAVPALHRTTSLADVVANASGGVLGVLAQRLGRALLRAAVRPGRRGVRGPLR